MVDRAEFLRLARAHGAAAVSVLARVSGDATLSPGVQVRAAVELLRAGFGGASDGADTRDLAALTDQELVFLARANGIDLDGE